LVSVICSDRFVRSLSTSSEDDGAVWEGKSRVEGCDVNEGCVKQATKTGCRVVLGGNDNRESNADRAVGVGILLGGGATLRCGLANRVGVVDIVLMVDVEGAR